MFRRNTRSLPLKPAAAADAPACAAILREWIDETPWFPSDDPPQADAAHLARKFEQAQVWVAGHPAQGFLALEEEYVSCLYVARRQRGRGLGRSLLDLAKDRRRELRLWTFRANHRAQVFYRREGFREVRRTNGADNDEGLPDIEFLWRAKETG